MRRFFGVWLMVAFTAAAHAQVTKLEYFIGTDPGYGLATPLGVAPGADVSKDVVVALANLSEGFYTVSFRAGNGQGVWSHTYSHVFYVVNSVAAQITEVEYFIDADPGYGKATRKSMSVGANGVLNYVIPLSDTSLGFHTLGIRSKDDLGRWSHTNFHVFNVGSTDLPSSIQKLEYYFTGNGSSGQVYTYAVPSPSAAIDVNFTANLSDLVGDRDYDIHIVVLDSFGVRSSEVVKKVKVCSGLLAKARFDFVTLGTEISFIDSSSGAGKYKWDFGDGKMDSVSNPVHKYTAGGTYQVKMIVSSFCNSDTIEKQINVLSLQKIYPNKGGNNGSVTINIVGAGFNAATKVKLIKGNKVVEGRDSSLMQGGRIFQAVFEFSGSEYGTWNLVVNNSTNDSAVLLNSFTVEPSIKPVLSVDVVGRGAMRLGTEQILTAKVDNNGNIDAHGVPVWFVIPHGTQVSFDFPILALTNNPIPKDSISTFFITDSLFENHVDSVDVYPFLLPVIAANTQFELPVKIFSTKLGTKDIRVFAFNPIYGSPPVPSFIDCFSDAISKSLSTNATTNDVFQCGNKISEFYNKTNAALTKHPCNSMNWESINNAGGQIGSCDAEQYFRKRVFSDAHIILHSIGVNLPGIAMACGGDAISLARLTGAETKKALAKFVGRIFFNRMKNAIKGNEACKQIFTIVGLKSFILQTVTSTDPNEKAGPAGNSNSNYNQGLRAFNYKIYFENKNTATAPAQEVIIIDTLDKTKFDLATFQLKSYGFGDSVNAFIPAGFQTYAFTFLLQRLGKPNLLVRVDAKLDTATGILHWRFLSLDPVTRELIDDPLDGFLPPNITSPQGEGFVSYSLAPKLNLPHGEQIKNKATIYFDNNAPITTNEFLNTIDKTKPVSSVTGIPTEVYDTTFTVQWSGADNGAGVRSYDVYYKINNGPYQLWQYDVSLSETTFTGKKDSTYSFFSISKDFAGNIEDVKTSAERTVIIKLLDSTDKTCQGGSTTFSATPAGAGFTYQWQVNTGTGFADISNNAIYAGVTTTQLTLTTPPTDHSNYKYRCKISNGSVTYFSSQHAVKFVATWTGVAGDAWETPANWSCGLVPDENTDVIISHNAPVDPVLNVTASCRSLTMNQTSKVIIRTGAKLIITGKL